MAPSKSASLCPPFLGLCAEPRAWFCIDCSKLRLIIALTVSLQNKQVQEHKEIHVVPQQQWIWHWHLFNDETATPTCTPRAPPGRDWSSEIQNDMMSTWPTCVVYLLRYQSACSACTKSCRARSYSFKKVRLSTLLLVEEEWYYSALIFSEYCFESQSNIQFMSIHAFVCLGMFTSSFLLW